MVRTQPAERPVGAVAEEVEHLASPVLAQPSPSAESLVTRRFLVLAKSANLGRISTATDVVLLELGGDIVMAGGLRRDTLFVALTRPQMFAGVTYSFFVINAVVAVELFLIFRSLWVLVIALVVHLFGMVASVHEPRFVDLWLTRVRSCPRVKNYKLWQCNSYRP